MSQPSPSPRPDAARHQPVHELVRSIAERYPERTAIERGSRRVTYAELAARAAGLAGRLLAAGEPRGMRVGILAEDPFAVIPAILAVLEAGGVFVPLDPLLPERRLAWMVEEVAPAWLLVEPGFAAAGERLAALPAAPRLQLLDERAAAGAGPAAAAHGPDDPCYVLFTSGSTGKPKGILGRLKGVDHFVRWEIDAFGIGAGTRVSQLTTPAHDPFLRDVFVPLCAGGTVCVPPDRVARLEPRQLAAWLHDADVHLLHCVPSLFRTLLDERLRPELFPGLRWVLLAGEPLLPADVRRWMEVFGERIELVNVYGPTETTLAKLVHRVRPEDRDRPVIPVGRPIRGARAVLVDDAGKICAPGVVGEIYIRTPFRSLGYFRRPELTREVFVPNPFSGDPEDVVYKTGDLGRIRDDGAIELLGRRDHQIKIRGVRVEPAEIESALREHGQVRDVVVVAREEREGESRLCAYLVAAGELTPEELGEFLARSLPELMIPRTFVFLDRLPHTLTGKVDRAALPPPPAEARAFVAPRTPTEELLAVVWQELLGRERVGAADDFFALGGHSLLALQMLSRIRDCFGVDLPLGEFLGRRELAALAAAIDELRRAGRGDAAPPLRPAPRDGDLPLSFGQQRLWFLDRLDPGRPAYNVSFAVSLAGPLAAGALAAALTRITARHEALRTVFAERHGRPLQRIAPPAPFPLPGVDLAALPAAARELAAAELGAAAALAPFDLAGGPLLRGLLLRRGAAEHDLVLTGHHIVLDNWSVGLLVGELNALYRETATGEPAALPALPVQYADFAVWQREWLRGAVLAEQLAYWREQLREPPALELPTDRPRPPVLGTRGARAGLVLAPRLAEGLGELSRREGLTLFMTLLAGFAALLQRYSGQRDLVVGTPVANRHRGEIEHLVGFFVNTLALRADLAGDPGLRELAARLRRVALDAYSHQDLPFEKLVEELQPRRDLSRQPLFQAMLVYQHGPGPRLDLPGLAARPHAGEVPRANFDLTLGVLGGARGLPVVLDYNVELFDGATAERLLGHLQELLAAAVARPDLAVSRLALLTAAERHQLLAEWQGEPIELPRGATLHGLFAAQAARTPGNVAVAGEGEEITYADLARRASALARRLRALGVGPDRVVGLSVERSPRLIVGVLGTLAAGGAYLPLDPELPAERLAWMLADAGAAVVLAEERTREAVAGSGARVVLLDAEPDGEPEGAAPAGGEGWGAGAAAANLAYVLYTSGSSGQPKGVMVTHGGICATLGWRLQEFGLAPGDRVLQNIPYTFDPAVWQTFGALLSGARLILVPAERHRDAPYLARTIREGAVTITDFPPSLLRVLLDGRLLAGSPALRCLFVGGEAFPPELAERGVADLGAGLYNAYGPTEACIDVACWACRREAGGQQRVPIGRPIAGKRVLLLDAGLEPVPIGLPGELFAGGDGLARGYVGRPDLTARSFVPDPFAAAPGARLYRTGDLARFRPDGVLEFLGRTDRQVKVRGLRIEPGGIEALLGRHPQVLAAAVLVREDAPGNPQLVAYFAPRDGAPERAALAAHLRRELPAYMVPNAFVELAALPLTANGKVDRDALLALPAPAAPAASYAAPRSELERILSEIWTAALQVERVGIDDSFFDLGGHSLLMIRVHARLAAALGREIPIVDLFTYPTIRALARAVAGEDGGGEAALAAEDDRAVRQLAARRRQRDRQKALRDSEAP
jgi:amino acid adenylation domain-containing protein